MQLINLKIVLEVSGAEATISQMILNPLSKFLRDSLSKNPSQNKLSLHLYKSNLNQNLTKLC